MRNLRRPHEQADQGPLSLGVSCPVSSGEQGWLAMGCAQQAPCRPSSGITMGEKGSALAGQGALLPSTSQQEVLPGLTGPSTPAPRPFSGCLLLRMRQGIWEGGRQTVGRMRCQLLLLSLSNFQPLQGKVLLGGTPALSSLQVKKKKEMAVEDAGPPPSACL